MALLHGSLGCQVRISHSSAKRCEQKPKTTGHDGKGKRKPQTHNLGPQKTTIKPLWKVSPFWWAEEPKQAYHRSRQPQPFCLLPSVFWGFGSLYLAFKMGQDDADERKFNGTETALLKLELGFLWVSERCNMTGTP